MVESIHSIPRFIVSNIPYRMFELPLTKNLACFFFVFMKRKSLGMEDFWVATNRTVDYGDWWIKNVYDIEKCSDTSHSPSISILLALKLKSPSRRTIFFLGYRDKGSRILHRLLRHLRLCRIVDFLKYFIFFVSWHFLLRCLFFGV